MNFDLFPREHSQNSDLLERVGNWTSIELPAVCVKDKWILSSAMQKSIRRGNEAVAVSIALRLQALDSRYLRRRLPVIALEDVGLGSIETCIEVITVCSSSRYWTGNATQSISYMVAAMARAIKSRAACDALCWSGVHPSRKELARSIDSLKPIDLAAVAADDDRPTIERVLASRLFGDKFLSGTFLKSPDAERDFLGLFVQRLPVPKSIEWLVRHRHGTAGMAMMLPLIFNIAGRTHVQPGNEFPLSSELCGGVPLAALDQYTRLGRTVVSELFGCSTKLQKFAQQKIHCNQPQTAISLALFQVDSAYLNQVLSSPELQEIRIRSEEAELSATGVAPQNQPELHELLRSEASSIAAIRKRILIAKTWSGLIDDDM